MASEAHGACVEELRVNNHHLNHYRLSVAHNNNVRYSVPEGKRFRDPSRRKYQLRRVPPTKSPARLTAELSAAWPWWPTPPIRCYETIR